MKNILCYGDSNTWGFVPGSLNINTWYMERFPRNVRWTGCLQAQLGSNYYVIEEGLCGRTTNIDNPPEEGGSSSNGKTYLQPCLFSHAPLDWVVLMLGPNDFKASLNRSAENAATGLEELINIIQASTYGPDMQHPPKILLIAPPFLNTQSRMFAELFKGADEKSKAFPKLCEKLVEKYGCDYLDMSEHIKMSEVDGLHIDDKDQLLFARLVFEKIL